MKTKKRKRKRKDKNKDKKKAKSYLNGGNKRLQQLRLSELAKESQGTPSHVLVRVVQVVAQSVTNLHTFDTDDTAGKAGQRTKSGEISPCPGVADALRTSGVNCPSSHTNLEQLRRYSKRQNSP